MARAAAAGNTNSPFWQFSLDFYARPGVADACLELQDSAGVDVNVLLYLLFVASQLRQVDRDDIARMDKLVKAWREHAVLPLRTLRRRLKSGITPLTTQETDALRNAIKRIELDAEKIEQELLERLLPASTLGATTATPSDAARTNLAAYGACLHGLPERPMNILLNAHAKQYS